MKFHILFLSFFLLFAVAAKAQEAPAKAEESQTLTLKVKGIQCSGDLPIINKNVEALEGVSKCEAVGDPKPTTVFTITYSGDATSQDAIVQAIEESPSCDFPDQKPYKVKK